VEASLVSVLLTRGKVALIDDEDVALVTAHRWVHTPGRNGRSGYAMTRINGRTTYMHRLILGVTDRWEQVDHCDRNGLNNTRANLRAATQSQNNANKAKQTGTVSSRKGVTYHKAAGKWMAQIMRDKHNYYLGLFESEDAAAEAYAIAARQHFGEFARTA
jgi:hypothetical protein